MVEVNVFHCVIERIKCPNTGRASLRLTDARPASRMARLCRCVGRLFCRYKDPGDVPVSDIVFAVDADKSALVAMLQPWRKNIDVEGGVKISFMATEPVANRHGVEVKL